METAERALLRVLKLLLIICMTDSEDESVARRMRTEEMLEAVVTVELSALIAEKALAMKLDIEDVEARLLTMARDFASVWVIEIDQVRVRSAKRALEMTCVVAMLEVKLSKRESITDTNDATVAEDEIPLMAVRALARVWDTERLEERL